MSMPESMMPTFTPSPVRPSSERAMSTPVMDTADARSGSTVLGCGVGTWTSVTG